MPNGTMRSILDYVGDGSKPGSFAKFPCDTSPAPNASLPDIQSSILSPAATLNPTGAYATGLPLATGKWTNGSIPEVVKTLVKPWFETTYVCPPGASETVALIHTLSEGVPITKTSTVGSVQTSGSENGVLPQSSASGATETGTPEQGVSSQSPSAPSAGNAAVADAVTTIRPYPTSGSSVAGGASASGTVSVPSTFTGDARRFVVNALVLVACMFVSVLLL